MNIPSRLLIVVNDPAFFLSHRLPIARAAKEQGFEVHVATPDEECAMQIRAEGFFFHPIPLAKHGTKFWEEIKTLKALFRLFRFLRPDLLHLVTIKPVLYGGVMARVARVPAVISAITGLGHLFVEQGVRISILRSLAKFAYRFALNHPAQKVIFQNSDDMAYFVAIKLVAKSKVVLIRGSGVDTNVFAMTSEPSGVPVVLLAGRMLWEKGVGEFVEAARRLGRSGVKARFVLVGESVPWNVSSVSVDQLLSWHQDGIIEWWGKKQNMPDVISQSAIVCLPSYGEGLPKVLIEAAACGRPIITTDTPGCREAVHDGLNGVLVSARNSKSLENALRRMIDDFPLRQKMGKYGRGLAEKEFSVERVIKETLEVYGVLMSSSPCER